jgi:hypothetical protein
LAIEQESPFLIFINNYCVFVCYHFVKLTYTLGIR